MPITNAVILVIEDEVDLNAIVADMLRDAGYEVLQAHDGDQGVALYREHAARVDLVVCDLSMPNFNGFECLRALVNQYGFVPFVVMSAQDDVNKLVEAVRLGAVDYVVKPLAIMTLVEQLPRWLNNAHDKKLGQGTAP